MPVTINAHQLGRLIDRTIGHIGDEFTELLHGIRLEADETFLYAVASDRYTVAAARYGHHDLDTEPFARTLPASCLPSLREWTSTQPGSAPITLTAAEDRLRFTAPESDLGIAVSPDAKFFDWRGILRGIIEQTTDSDDAFPVLATRLLGRFGAADDRVRVRVTADQQAVLIAAEDFLGAQMPARRYGFGADELTGLDQVEAAWQPSLSAGAAAAMPDDIPARPDRPRYEVSHDIAETAGDLLKQTLRSTGTMLSAHATSSEAFAAHAIAGVTAWTAYRYLDALLTADPRLAATVVAETADQLDSGEIGEFAWDAAEEAGHDPSAWREEFEAQLASFLQRHGTGQPGQEPALTTCA